MKPILLQLLLILSINSFSQNNPNDITGKWMKTPKKDIIIQVYKVATEYRGKITWVGDKLKKKDVGFMILQNLKYSPESNSWKNGKIHNPNNGKSYDAEARIKPDGTMEVLAYKGMKFLGTKKYFARVK